MEKTKRSKRKLRKTQTESKKIVRWAIWYTNLTTILWSIIYIIKGSVSIELVGLTGFVITGVIVSYFIKAKGENIAKIETGGFDADGNYIPTCNNNPMDISNNNDQNNFYNIQKPDSYGSTIIYTGTPQKEEVNV